MPRKRETTCAYARKSPFRNGQSLAKTKLLCPWPLTSLNAPATPAESSGTTAGTDFPDSAGAAYPNPHPLGIGAETTRIRFDTFSAALSFGSSSFSGIVAVRRSPLPIPPPTSLSNSRSSRKRSGSTKARLERTFVTTRRPCCAIVNNVWSICRMALCGSHTCPRHKPRARPCKVRRLAREDF